MYLIFDTETTGLPKDYKVPITDTDNWPRCVQVAWQLHNEWGELVENNDFLIQPEGFDIPFKAQQIHGISTQLASEKGVALSEVLRQFNEVLEKTTFLVGQNIDFDINILGCEFHRLDIASTLHKKPLLDTCTEVTANLCKLPGGKGGKYKYPGLSELYHFLFQESFAEAHNATADVEATSRCFFELIRQEVFSIAELRAAPDYLKKFQAHHPKTIRLSGLSHLDLRKESTKIMEEEEEAVQEEIIPKIKKDTTLLSDIPFVHLHNHSQFSVLESTASTSDLIQTAVQMNMPAVALTDLGNMMGAFSFVQEAIKHNKKIAEENKNLPEGTLPKQPIKPIVGSELYVCKAHTDKKSKDNGYRMVFLAKDKKAYHNLAKMSSLSHTKGFYYVPRIDKKIIEQYKEGLIVLSGGLQGELSSKLLQLGEKQAEESLLWWQKTFGDDFYLEVMRHGLESEDYVNEVFARWSEEYGIKVVATNNTYFINKEDAEAQDILLCVKEGEKQATPKGYGRGYRRGLANDSYYFKSQEEMKELFADWPETIKNIREILDKVSIYDLSREVLLPEFQLPKAFTTDDPKEGENNYLRYLTYEGAKKRWDVITPEIQERIDFELNTIKESNYPGYFLIIWDLIAQARKMGVSVGPGRGSAAGSAVAYCLWITNVDPIKYDLLFERFLNPKRISLPDIDIDFDDEGRQKVIDYVIEKYGHDNVAQIITYGTLGAKSSIRDTGRVMELPLHDTDRIAKLVPNVRLHDIFIENENNKQTISKLKKEDQLRVNEIKNIADGEDLEAITLQQALKIEGAVRNTGVHACGLIITPQKITELIPIATAKDTEMYVTQFDNNSVESAGLLKMDFLGLKTLTLIKDTVEIIEAIHKIKLDPDEFPLDDKKTYELFQKGETIGIFQFESPNMRKYLKDLKPTEFADLIAMVALHRPGPMDNIPLYIDRKYGVLKINYDLPEMEDVLKDTYGVTVYQEQVMRLSQKLADFTRGEADVLRKAMGKKDHDELNKMKSKFLTHGEKNGHPKNILQSIWQDWEKFADYAFNKSHATCYALIAYQTAYLKAYYPAEFMAATLSNNMSDIKKITFYMDECRHSGIPVLGPDINESWYKFAVNKEGAIRFGMGGVKGVGEGAVASIVAERKKNGPYKSVFDMAKRVDLRAVNKRVFEGLAFAGGFDSFKNTHRAQYFATDEKGTHLIDKAIRYGNHYQEDVMVAQLSLFGDENSETALPEPVIPPAEKWMIMEELSKEKEVVGIYISGHPLDNYKYELRYFCNTKLKALQDSKRLLDKGNLSVGGIVTSVERRISKNGQGWAIFSIEDYSDSHEFRIFKEDYLKYQHFLVPNAFLYIKFSIVKAWKEGETRIEFKHFEMLQEVLEKMSKTLTIQLDIKELNNEFIQEFAGIIKTYKGKKELNFIVYDSREQLKLHMPGRKFKIEITNDLLELLEENQWPFILK